MTENGFSQIMTDISSHLYPVKNNLSEWHRFDIACHHRLLIVFRIVFRNRKRYRFDGDIAIVITYRFVCIETMLFLYCYDIV